MTWNVSTVLFLLAVAATPALGQSRSVADSIRDAVMRRRLDSALAGGAMGDSADWRAADSLLSADADRELAIALRRGDHRFLAYGGVSLIVPVVDSLEERCLRKAYEFGLRQLDNTTDAVSTRAQVWLKYAAGRFAERYNRLLLARLRLCRQ